MKKNVHFKYQLYDCYVPLKTYVKLEIQCFYLRIRRFLRFCKRCLTYLKKYILIVLCVVIFEAIIIPFGICLGKYQSWIDGFWDLRNFMLTSIMIAILMGILSLESKRHKDLITQYMVYKSFEDASERFIGAMCSVVGIKVHQDIFLSEKDFDDFYEKIVKESKKHLPIIKNSTIVDKHLLYSTKEFPRKVAIKIYFEQYVRALNNVNNALLLFQFIGPVDHAIEQINYIYNEIQAEQIIMEEQGDGYTDIHLLKFVNSVSRSIYPAVADLRHPWRWDIKINDKITQIINMEKNRETK